MNDDVELTGPLFDGTAERAAARGVVVAREKVAQVGEQMAASALRGAIQHSVTGRAVASVTSTSVPREYATGKYTMPVVVDLNETVVTTDLATYGPWLEGTGSRNLTTRFKGYHSFRKAGQELELSAGEIADLAFQPYLKEMQ